MKALSGSIAERAEAVMRGRVATWRCCAAAIWPTPRLWPRVVPPLDGAALAALRARLRRFRATAALRRGRGRSLPRRGFARRCLNRCSVRARFTGYPPGRRRASSWRQRRRSADSADTEPAFEGWDDAGRRPRGREALVVNLEGFEGPLDLLLALARTQKVDLAKISVLALAEQYLVFIDQARSCGWSWPPTTW